MLIIYGSRYHRRAVTIIILIMILGMTPGIHLFTGIIIRITGGNYVATHFLTYSITAFGLC